LRGAEWRKLQKESEKAEIIGTAPQRYRVKQNKNPCGAGG